MNKDRHGGLRRHCPAEGKEPSAGLFCLTPSPLGDGILEPVIRAPQPGDKPPKTFGINGKDVNSLVADIAAIDSLDPPPTSKEDVKDRLRWGSGRAHAALKTWRDQRSES
ncbi:hypothetical protein [Nocardia sp. NPDC049149]|uniref:hypothetical protein n=1 Tax=Nocardia sp. NPDC049149 TaxID=3364315 RepID=UPI00371507B2